MGALDQYTGIQPQTRGILNQMAAAMAGDIAINVITAVVTPAPTAAAWSYTVAFEIVDSNGQRHEWYNDTISAAASDDSTAGTASVSDATPSVVNGFGTVDLEGDAASWADTEVATLTLDATIMGYDLTDATWTATFTAA
jgi:hypothetical protein